MCTSRIRPSEKSPILPNTHCTQTDVNIGERNREQTAPRPPHMVAIEATGTPVAGLSEDRALDLIFTASDEMTHRVAAEGIASQQDHVRQKYKRTYADSK